MPPTPLQLRPGRVSSCLYSLLSVITLGLVIVFVWNEWSVVSLRRTIEPVIEGYTAVSCEPSDRFNNRLISIDCPLRNLHTFYPPSEFSWNVEAFKGAFFEMRVEMYQWTMHKHGFGVDIGGIWADMPISSPSSLSFFFPNSRTNPGFFPHVNGAGRHFAPDLYAGGFRLSPKHLVGFKQKRQLPIKEDGFYYPSEERPPADIDYSNTRVINNALYTGDPKHPQVGDLKISFWGSSATHVSMLGVQREVSHFGKEFTLGPYRNVHQHNASLELISEGDYSADQLMESFIVQQGGSAWFVWGLRIATFGSVALFVFYSHRLCDTKQYRDPVFVACGAFTFSCSALLLAAAPMWVLCSLLIGITMIVLGIVLLIPAVIFWTRPRINSLEIELMRSEPSPHSAPTAASPSRSPQQKAHYYQPV